MGQRQEVSGNRVRGDLVVSQTFIQQTTPDTSRDRVRQEAALALLHGPVEALGLGSRLKRAQDLGASGDHEEAGEIYRELAPLLEAAGRDVTAEVMRERAAAQFKDAGLPGPALELYVEVTRSELARDADGAQFTARRAREVASDADRWLADALIARAVWPEHEDEVVPLLAHAWDRTRDTADEAEWAAALVEVLSVLGRLEEAVDVAEDVARRIPVELGPRLWLELDRLDAAGELGHEVGADWDKLVDWTRGRDDATRALVLQRRGVFLSRRDRPEDSVAAFREAATHWGRVSGGDEQLAESYFAEHVAWELAGRFAWGTDGTRAIASELAGDPRSPAARAQRLLDRAVRELLDGKQLFEAKRCLLLALATHRRAGNLRGILEVHDLLARLFDRVGDRGRTVAHYVACGDAKKAGEAAKAAETWDWSDASRAIRLGGTPWERAASYAVVAEVGGQMPDDEVAGIASELVEAARQPYFFAPGPQVAHQARRALAAVICSLPDPPLERALEILRDEVRKSGWSDREAARALSWVTHLGRSDQAPFLLEASVASDANAVRGEAGLVIERLRDDRHLRNRAREAALEGNEEALELLAYAGLDDAEVGLRELCAERVRKYVEQAEPDPTPGQRSAALISLEALGALGRYCDPKLRQLLADRLLRFALDPEELDPSRVGAVGALLNLADSLRAEDLEGVREALFPLAVGAYSSKWEHALGSNDPFSRIQISIGQPGELQGMAIQAFCAATPNPADSQAQLSEVLRRALGSRDPALIGAALNGLLHLPSVALGDEFALFLRHSEARIRATALRLLASRESTFLDSEAARALAADPSPFVRSTLLAVARDIGDAGERALAALIDDPEAYIRVAARNAASAALQHAR